MISLVVRFVLVAAVAVLVLAGAPSSAVADETDDDGVVRLGIYRVNGLRMRPSVFFIDTRRALVFQSQALRESFTDEIAKVVDEGDF